jgi:tRNA A-37 threonylcarbamoyl transferase component Bud32
MGGKKTVGTGKGEGCYIVAVALDLREQLQHSLGEAYRIERELGGGGMSRVFLALETSLQRRVVVKVLLPELAAGVSVERFRREIHLAAQLQHPHIVPLLSAGESVGLPYFTMPYVDGESLRARLLRERELPVPHAARVLRDVAAALAYAHAQGVVHRDIKPDNVLLSHGVAVVTDFGVAKALTVSTGPDAAAHHPGLTSLGITLGTPAYMAPEQGAADPGMDHRVDIYAFGAMAYEMLAGEPPFTGPSPQAILGAHIAGIPKAISTRRPGTPPLLAHLIMKCLEKRPADRPQSADEIIGTLDMLSTPSGTVPVTTMRSAVRGARWHPLLAGVRRYGPAVAAAALVGIAALLVWPRRATTPETAPDQTVAAPARPPETPPAPAPVAEPAPSRPAAETTAAAPAEAPAPRPQVEPPVRAPAPPPARRSEAVTPRPSTGDSVVLARLQQEAAAARTRAVAAAADDSIIARGDSGVARAESLARVGRSAEAAAALSSSTALWSAAAARPPVAKPRPPLPSEPAAPPRDSVVAPAADPTREIQALFAEYGAAIEARSLEAIRRTYPGMLPSQAREWEEFFRSVTDIDVELAVSDLKVSGNAAEARLEGVYVFRNPSTHRTQHEPVGFQATLRREGTRWRIASLR